MRRERYTICTGFYSILGVSVCRSIYGLQFNNAYANKCCLGFILYSKISIYFFFQLFCYVLLFNEHLMPSDYSVGKKLTREREWGTQSLEAEALSSSDEKLFALFTNY